MNGAKHVLMLLRQAPYRTAHALEAADVALVAGAFEQSVSVLFEGDGVWQLVKDQDGGAIGTRTIGRVLSALPRYEVDAIYVCADSLAAAGLTADDLVIPATPLSRDQQRALIARQDAVVND
jgi:tRNA 2-thiouridine synthesizing protein C